MVDVATVSVISSSVVAVGSLVVTFLGGERQRSHEASLDFEQRIWEQKSVALFAVIEQCQTVLESDGVITEQNRRDYAIGCSRLLDGLLQQRAAVEAFASSGCRDALDSVIEQLRLGGVKERVAQRRDQMWSQLGKLSEADKWGDTQRLLTRIREAQEEAVANFDIDLPKLRTNARKLREEARDSVRRQAD